MRLSLFTLILALIAVSIATTPTLRAAPHSQGCVKCGIKNNCRICTGGGDALYCETFNCGACMEEGNCPAGGIGRSDTQPTQVGPKSIAAQEKSSTAGSHLIASVPQTNEFTVISSVQYNIDINTVKSVAARHPRFAATLVQLGNHGIQRGSYIMHWTPVEITLSDVDKWLNQKGNDDYFRRFEKRCRDLNKLIEMGQVEEIRYYVTIENHSPSALIISIRVANEHSTFIMDPPYSALEIRIPYADNMVSEPVKGVRLTWQPNLGKAFEESPSRPNS